MLMPTPPLLSVDGIDVTVPGRRLVDNLSLELRTGEITAVLGRNGSGKTRTLTALSGLDEVHATEVRVSGDPIARLPRRTLAQRLALLPQHVEDVFPTTVIETVMIGRYPYVPALGSESAGDREIALSALGNLGLHDLVDRDVLSLSGGERRRLAIAQVLAQQPDIYLLDEPTNHLDPQHQLDVMQLFRRLADAGATVLVALHDLNLAARFADRGLLLFGDGRWQLDDVATTMTEERLSELYSTAVRQLNADGRPVFVAGGLID